MLTPKKFRRFKKTKQKKNKKHEYIPYWAKTVYHKDFIRPRTLTILRISLISMAKQFRLSYHGPHHSKNCFWTSSDFYQLRFQIQELP